MSQDVLQMFPLHGTSTIRIINTDRQSQEMSSNSNRKILLLQAIIITLGLLLTNKPIPRQSQENFQPNTVNVPKFSSSTLSFIGEQIAQPNATKIDLIICG